VVALSSGIKISAVHHLVLSRSTHVTDWWMDGQTELRLPRPPSHRCLGGKKCIWYVHYADCKFSDKHL